MLNFNDIADHQILNKREAYRKTLSNYVPFHFYPKNPFDGKVCKECGAENMAIIAIRRNLHNTTDFYIIPSHPLDRDEPDIYPYNEGFQQIRWDILDSTSGRDYHNPEIKKACMAECVTAHTIPHQNFHCIFVASENALQKILHVSQSYNVPVTVNPHMFP